MALTVSPASGTLRFEALLRGGALAAHDQVLLERPDWLVAPTLGAIVPDWLLIIPRDPVLTFRDWSVKSNKSPEGLMQEVREHLGLGLEDVIWFEHGPAVEGTLVGCGLDHAHIHMLVRQKFSFAEFAACARSLADLEWREVSADLGYGGLEKDSSYNIAGCGDHVIMASQVETLGSQFFRRVVGALAGRSGAWDYRQFAHPENVAQTIDTFRSLEGAVQRAR